MKKRQLLLTEDGSHTLFIPELNETYHSTHGAIQESNHVFIKEGLKYYLSDKSVDELWIFEVGFGTGLNALLTAIFAEQNNTNIIYDAIEAFPLEATELKDLNYTYQIKSQSAAIIFSKMHTTKWNELMPISNNFKIKKIHRQIQDYHLSGRYDICYFDAFAPSKQPEMWEKSTLEKIYHSLKTDGIFVTYSAQGQLKRNLKAIGFEVHTIEGPPGKYEMVRGIKT